MNNKMQIVCTCEIWFLEIVKYIEMQFNAELIKKSAVCVV